MRQGWKIGSNAWIRKLSPKGLFVTLSERDAKL